MTDNDRGELSRRKAPIDMGADEFRAVGHRLVDDIADYLASVRERPVTRAESPSELRRLLPNALPEHGTPAEELLREVTPLLFEHSLFSGHPRFFGYIVSSPTPIGALGDLLAATVNANCGGYQIAPMAAEIERQTVRWIADLIGYPAGGGIFVSGGNMANMVAFLAARRAQADWNIRETGLTAGKGHMLIYATDETHTWIHKAADLFGHGTDVIRPIPMDDGQRARVESLREMIESDRRNGHTPFLIVGSAGTVSTGAVDPLRDLAAVAREYDLWFHVDGAYGALSAMLPDAPADIAALSEADSVAVDPHKWLYSPVEAGVTLVRDADALPNAFRYRPPYYRFETEDEPRINYYEHGPQNSRHFRALKVWLGLRQVGRQGYQRMLADDCRLARELFRSADAHSELEAVTTNLSITTFRYVPLGLVSTRKGSQATPHRPASPGPVETYLNELNEVLLQRIKDGGELFLSNAIVGERFVLRACIVNFRTSLEDIESIPEIVARYGRASDSEMRPSNLS